MEALSPQADNTSSRLWEKSATRDAVLAAARRIAERDGVLEMSLTAVAAEAGFAPAAVYAHFATRNDLLQSIIADDLATLAGEMRRSFESDTPKFAAREIHQVPNPAGGAPQDSSADAGISIATGGGEAAGAADAIARLQKTVARLESRPVDAWLERRLRELERALTALEGRQGERGNAEKNVDDRFRDVNRSLDTLEHRLLTNSEDAAQRFGHALDACETRLRQLISETHGESLVLARRLTAVENAAFAVKPEFFTADIPPGSPPEPTIEPADEPVGSQSASAEPILGAADVSPYLEAARKSAQAAAQEQIVRGHKQSRRHSDNMVYLAMGSLFLFVAMLTAMGLLLRNQALHDKPAPTTAAIVAAPHGVRTARSSSASRLSALAEAGNPAAELVLGLGYLSAVGAKNDALAFAWLSRAAAQNLPVAEYELALLYRKGQGVHTDAAQAFHWFDSAALAGNRKAMHSLATAYAEGWGTQQNFTDAARWYARAATLGSVNDQFNLGVMYERGMGVPQSLSDAYKWYAIAAAQGDQESQARIAALASTLSPDELAAAQSAAGSFKPDPIVAAANLPPKAALLK